MPNVRRFAMATAATSAIALALGLSLTPASAARSPAGSPAGQAPTDPAALVQPLAGTANGGGTFPGAAVPFGMVDISPNTPNAEGGGYEYADPVTWGFGMTHLSGPGCSTMGDVVSLPTTGTVGNVSLTSQEVPFSHSSEQASPGYYSVLLGSGIKTELTATTRTGWQRYTYPQGTAQGNVVVEPGADFQGAISASIQVVGNNTLTGSATGYGFFNNCGGHSYNTYTVYFAMTFSQPFAASGAGNGAAITAGAPTASGANAGAWVSFGTSANPVVVSKTGISYVSVADAQENLAAETGGSFDFDHVRAQATADWNHLLRRVEVTGGPTEQQQTFYTALYHSLLYPNIVSDVNGDYVGFDGQVHRATGLYGTAHYSDFSLWDTYRTQAELLELVTPEQIAPMMMSLVADAQQGGWLPRWPYDSNYTNEMVGDSAAPVLADAIAKGFLSPGQAQAAYAAMVHNATQLPLNLASEPFPYNSEFQGRIGLAEYLDSGYVSLGSQGGNQGDSSSAGSDTLEYGIDDCSISLTAARLGQRADEQQFLARSQDFLNLADPGTGFLYPRQADGSFLTPFDPTTETGYREGSAWQYNWLAPQDVTGLVTALGGTAAATSELDQFFGYPGLIAGGTPQPPSAWGAAASYNPGNEPDLQAPYLYDYLGQPWKTADVVDAAEQLYSTAPGGIPGNDDLGEMSAWYVMSSLGLYPMVPGDPFFALTTPAFDQAVVKLQRPWYRAGQLVIDAPGVSGSQRYVQSATVNGHAQNHAWISNSQISAGARLALRLGGTPGSWATSASAAPPSPCSRPASGASEVSAAIAGSGTIDLTNGLQTEVPVVVTNPGPATVRNVTASIVLPDGWTGGGQVTDDQALAPGQSVTLTIPVTMNTSAGPSSATIEALVGWAGPDGAGNGLTTLATAQAGEPLEITSVTPDSAYAGQLITVDGTGFGATQGASYLHFADDGVNWGEPGNRTTFVIDSWSDTQITFTLPEPSDNHSVVPGSTATVEVHNSDGQVSNQVTILIT
jgi:predicted alpha-1,2-mannosidase